jgi:hypothetical protein
MRWEASTTLYYHHDILPHNEPRISRAKDYGLKSLKLWNK